MAMLAEPKSKKRYNLVPRGKALYEDSNRFGTKMLEKMGWSKGKGLGPNENGNQDFVRVKYKNDVGGLGYEERDDQWTVHANSFNGLLNMLNNTEGNPTKSSDEDPSRVSFGFQPQNASEEAATVSDKLTIESLEAKSKNSRARVHYQKFTRGKDLSKYSEKDLANIFGKKFFQITPETRNIIAQENTADDDYKKNYDFGITTVKANASVRDYFKSKMEKLKQAEKGIHKKIENCNAEPEDTQGKQFNAEINCQLSKMKGNLKAKAILLTEQIDQLTQTNTAVAQFDGASENPKKKKRKSGNEDILETKKNFLETGAKKKKKKKLSKQDNIPNQMEYTKINDPSIENVREISQEILSKKKKNKMKVRYGEHVVGENPAAELELEDTAKISKQTKNSDKEASQYQEDSRAANNLLTITPAKFSLEAINEGIETSLQLELKNSTDELPNPLRKQKEKCKTKEAPNMQDSSDNINTYKGPSSMPKEVWSETVNEVAPQPSLLTELQLSKYKAEIFRFTNLNAFEGSNFKSIIGYGCADDISLKVTETDRDEEKIAALWHRVLESKNTGDGDDTENVTANTTAQQQTQVQQVSIRKVKKKSFMKNMLKKRVFKAI